MHGTLIRILETLRNRHIIGHKHFPERLAIYTRIKYLPRKEQDLVLEEYRLLVKSGYFIRQMKRTGKGSEWHISINPGMLNEIDELIGDEDETAHWELL